MKFSLAVEFRKRGPLCPAVPIRISSLCGPLSSALLSGQHRTICCWGSWTSLQNFWVLGEMNHFWWVFVGEDGLRSVIGISKCWQRSPDKSLCDPSLNHEEQSSLYVFGLQSNAAGEGIIFDATIVASFGKWEDLDQADFVSGCSCVILKKWCVLNF